MGPSKTVYPYRWLGGIAASLAVVSIGYWYASHLQTTTEITPEKVVEVPVRRINSLGELSPELKKIEDFYLINVNEGLLNLSEELQQSEWQHYLQKLGELDTEYKSLIDDLNQFGTNPLIIQALINNLQLRLDLLYQINEKIKQSKTENNENETLKF